VKKIAIKIVPEYWLEPDDEERLVIVDDQFAGVRL
jgi:hypothetical protein